MGGSESFVDNYIRQYGMQGLFKLVLLKKKISWLQGPCTNQINRKTDDEIKYLLFHMDELINDKKVIILQLYKQTKQKLLQLQPAKVRQIQQKNNRLLENIYGKNHTLDKLNSIKISFHIEVHLTKKKVKKSIEEKIANIQNTLLYQTTDIPIAKHVVDSLFQQGKKQFELLLDDPQLKSQLQQFKTQTIEQLNFDYLFWPWFDKTIHEAQNEVEKTQIEAEHYLNRMKRDLIGDWTQFNK